MPRIGPPIQKVATTGIVVKELIESRKWALTSDDPQAEFVYDVTGSADDKVIRTYLVTNLPGVVEGLLLERIDLEPIAVDTVRNQGRWKATAVYQTQASDAPDDDFDTSGGSTHITQSRRTVSVSAAPNEAPLDTFGAINVDGKSVNGLDIVTPVYNFSESYTFLNTQLTSEYRGILFHATGKINDSRFRVFQAGEVLFLGATGARVGSTKRRVTFKFAASPNQSDIQVGPITVPEKLGWDYIWVQYKEQEDEHAPGLIRVPTAVYVEQVYERTNFAQLGIGTGPNPLT